MWDRAKYEHQYYLDNQGKILARSKKHYQENKEKAKERIKQWRIINIDRYSAKQKEWWNGRSEEFRMWKEFAGPCERCGNGDGRVLEFHHLIRKEKKFDLKVNNWYARSLSEIIEELGKCQVLCSNCHKITEFEKW